MAGSTPPLSDILRALESGVLVLTFELAEEAVRAVAAEVVLNRLELRRLDAWARTTGAGFPHSAAGRALVRALCEVVDDLSRPGRAFDPWTWTTPRSQLVEVEALLRLVRERAQSDIDASIATVLMQYPKATLTVSEVEREPTAEVRATIQRLKGDWLDGHVVNEADLVAPLRALLESRYR
jgi:hypothetical protein